VGITQDSGSRPLGMGKKKLFAFFAVALMVIAAFYMFGYQAPSQTSYQKAGIDDLLASKSTRNSFTYDAVIASLDSAYYALMATPLAIYYEGKENKTFPLIVVGEDQEIQDHGVSKSVKRFFEAKPSIGAVSVGKTPDAGAMISQLIEGGTVSKTSFALALRFWKQTDTVLLVKESQDGYNLGMPAGPLASYLNMPIIVTKSTADAMPTLDKLGVKNVIIAGKLDPCKKTWKLKNVDDISNITALGVKAKDGKQKSVLVDRLGSKCEYVTLANPIDAHHPKVLAQNVTIFEGTLTSKDTGSVYFPTTADPTHTVTVPADWKYVNVILDSYMPFTKSPDPRRDPDKDGQRSYVYFGIDENSDGAMEKMEFFAPSLAYENIRDSGGNALAGHAYMEHPIFESPGEHVVQIAGTLHMQFPENLPWDPPVAAPTTKYNITVTVQKLEDPIFPYMHNMSSMAPYLTAYHRGVILGEPEYAVNGGGPDLSCSCDPVISESGMQAANNKTIMTKKALNSFLARLDGASASNGSGYTELAGKYAAKLPQAFPVAFCADPGMIPWYYYPTSGQVDEAQQGMGLPSDNFYADIDADPENPPFSESGGDPSLELAVGRVIGWDVQDQSALIARTIFYNDIIGSFEGHSGQSWKNSALSSFGSKVPVGLAQTVTAKLNIAWTEAGYRVNTRYDLVLSDREHSGPYYERSNFIFFCAHGFFYWYVPPGWQKDGVGGGFDVAHVKDMNFGPSVIFGSSCVTGKTDGLPAYNTISQTFIHSGMNAYIGASRLSWGGFSPLASTSGEVFGGYLGLLLYGYLTGYVYDKAGGMFSEGISDLTVAQALTMAKNEYVRQCGTDGGGAHDDTVEEFTLYGDPLFNPYEPNHNG